MAEDENINVILVHEEIPVALLRSSLPLPTPGRQGEGLLGSEVLFYAVVDR
jgi:hypothetical protein